MIIPDSVEHIGRTGTFDAGVFQGCRSLQKVVFEGNNVKVIGDFAFCYTAVESMELKEGIATVGAYAFDSCSNLSRLVWPTSITAAGEKIFDGCAKLHELAGSSSQGAVVSYLQSTSVNQEPPTDPEERDIREVITYQQGDGTNFRYNKIVKKIIIGPGVTEIAENAFSYCSNLAEVDLGSGCKELGQGAFSRTAIREVIIPDSVEQIGRTGTTKGGVFQFCSHLQKVVFEGNNVKIIGAWAFAGIAAETIELKEGVTTIGEYAFARCSNLSTLVWPTSVTTVGTGVFFNCPKLHELAGSESQDDVITYLKSKSTPGGAEGDIA